MKSKDDKFIYGDGGDEPGPVCLKLLTTLKGIQMGKVEDKLGWCVEVPKPTLDISEPTDTGVNGNDINQLP